MKTRKRFSISFTIMTLLIAGLLVSCQQRENYDERVQEEVEDFREDLNDLDATNEDFADNLHSELQEFEESLNDIEEDMNEQGEQVSMEVRQAINDLQAEARSLRMKIETRTEVEEDEGLLGDTGDEDAVPGEGTAQAQRDTTIDDTTETGEPIERELEQAGQEIESEFQSFRQNVDQWADRLSANIDEEVNEMEETY
ncbi:MAG: hypothetical protein ACOC10_11660 [Bacteroidota bacterium]